MVGLVQFDSVDCYLLPGFVLVWCGLDWTSERFRFRWVGGVFVVVDGLLLVVGCLGDSGFVVWCGWWYGCYGWFPQFPGLPDCGFCSWCVLVGFGFVGLGLWFDPGCCVWGLVAVYCNLMFCCGGLL